MKRIARFEGKHVLVIGMGISGYAVAKLLNKQGAHVTVNEVSETPSDEVKVQELKQIGISYIGGGHDIAILHDIDIVVKNPGIPYYAPFIQAIIERDIPIITEPEVAMSVCEAKVIALTGTNGKTTTTMLLYEMLKNYHEEVYFAGNIGIAFSEVAEKATANSIVVLELSSFQLMGMPSFSPKVAMILNLDEAHLDYHTDEKEYIMAKLNIFKHLKQESTYIINEDDETLVSYVEANKPHAKAMGFSLKHRTNGAYLHNGKIYYQEEKICNLADIVVPGAHNVQNVLASISAAKQVGINNQSILKALTTFSGVEHRLEYVMTLNERRFYNDSKSTNVKAAQVALSAFQQPIVWIAGGLDRGNDISGLIPFCERVKMIVTFGESQAKFVALADKMRISVARAETLAEATQVAYEFSETEDIILLSPACASWDQFKSFEERGRLFKEYCQALVD